MTRAGPMFDSRIAQSATDVSVAALTPTCPSGSIGWIGEEVVGKGRDAPSPSAMPSRGDP